MANSPDVVCIGETMLMFAPPPYELLGEAEQFKVMVGGSESNVAIGLGCLGISSGWIGKLPNNPLGKRVAGRISSLGVDTSEIIWADTGRIGLFFFQWGSAPRNHLTIYDREHSAASTIASEDLNWDYVLNAKWLHLTGITPALSRECHGFTHDLIERAKRANVKISFDINYRSQLWDQAAAVKAYEEILPKVDLIIGTKEDIFMILGKEYAPEEALELCFKRYKPQVLAMTRGDDGAYADDGNLLVHTPGHNVNIVNRLGAGDAFAAGLLGGLILEEDLEYALRKAVAMAALKMTLPMNEPIIQLDDVESLLSEAIHHNFR